MILVPSAIVNALLARGIITPEQAGPATAAIAEVVEREIGMYLDEHERRRTDPSPPYCEPTMPPPWGATEDDSVG